jgi:hypothetical protein
LFEPRDLCFSGDDACTEIEARVNCIFKTLGYIEESGGCQILDLNYYPWKSLCSYVLKFEEQIEMIRSYGPYFTSLVEKGLV